MRVVLHHGGKETIIPNALDVAIRAVGEAIITFLKPGDRVECQPDRVKGGVPSLEPLVHPEPRLPVKPPKRQPVAKRSRR